MNEIERKLLGYEYLTNIEKLEKDQEEFADVVKQFFNIVNNSENLSKVSPMDLLDVMISIKSFSDQLKPFVIKYGIIKNLM